MAPRHLKNFRHHRIESRKRSINRASAFLGQMPRGWGMVKSLIGLSWAFESQVLLLDSSRATINRSLPLTTQPLAVPNYSDRKQALVLCAIMAIHELFGNSGVDKRGSRE